MADLAAADVVVLSRGVDGTLHARADGLVGTVRVGDVQVVVRPKVPTDRLLFLLAYSQDPSLWRDGHVHLERRDDLVDAVAASFVLAAERALRRGVLHGYVEVEDSLQVLRGRLRVRDQMRRFGLPVPVEVRYDDYTVDVAENRLLRAAAAALLRLPRVDTATRRRLRRLLLQLDGVRDLVKGHPLPAWLPTRLNRRYHPACRLAELVLRRASVEQGEEAVVSDGFLLRPEKVFEDFVVTALGEVLTARAGGRAHPQASLYLDEARRVPMRPDLLWCDDAARPGVVVDAKYKKVDDGRHVNADLYQLLAYCTVTDLDEGHLVYARGLGEPLEHVVQRAGVRLRQHALDLGLPPTALLEQVEELALRF